MNRQTVFDVIPFDTGGIVFAGDSHIQRFEVSEFFQRLDVKNRGIDGDIAAGLLNRLPQIIRLRPTKIFIMIGTNDIMKYSLPADSTARDVSTIISRLKNACPAAKLYLHSILPCKGLKAIQPMNSRYAAICKVNNVTFINMYGYFNKNESLRKEYDCGDGIHLNGKGYKKWKEIIDPYVKYGFTYEESTAGYKSQRF